MISIAGSIGSLNILLAVVCGILAGWATYRIRSNTLSKASKNMLTGIALFAGGWSLQRAYWAVGRSLEAMGADYIHSFIYTTSSWITIIPLSVALIGAGLIMAPVLETIYGERWKLKYIITMLASWLILALLL